MCDCCEEHAKKCDHCGQIIRGTGILRNGKHYCSEDCAKAAGHA